MVPPILPNALASPHAPHWSSAGMPDLNPTAGICSLLQFQGIQHPWLERTTQRCWQILFEALPREAYTLLSATYLAEYHPDPLLAERISEKIAASLREARFFIPYAPVREYGLTPLHFARTPSSRCRRLFSDEQIDGHLDDLLQKQQPDGGWPTSWELPGPAAACEWRGR